MPATATRLSRFSESVIRAMTRLANQHGAINLAQGFPDFEPPEELLAPHLSAPPGGRTINADRLVWTKPHVRLTSFNISNHHPSSISSHRDTIP